MKGGPLPEQAAKGEVAKERHVDPVIEAYKKDVDVTLIQAMLQLSVEQRLINLEQAVHNLAELRRAGTAAMDR